jgi:ubiquinone/menaquinone biosynthesis C-methylase UbiE
MRISALPAEVSLQRTYYTRTADQYDAWHVHEADEHTTACKIVSAFLPLLGARTVLDVGCGTGRAASILSELDPTLRLFAVDPVIALVEKARQKLGGQVVVSDGARLPFRDGALDVVVATGILHHVRDPDAIIREMIRVSRLAMFISDGNVFGEGSKIARLVKRVLYDLGLWRVAKFIQTQGKGYSVLDGDGVAYSYSVFFSYRLLCEHFATTFNIPLDTNIEGRLRSSRLFSAQHHLICAIREGVIK